MGLLSRLHGLTVDYLDAVELVHVTQGRACGDRDGQPGDAPIRTSKICSGGTPEAGGGNFGIVTKFFFGICRRAGSKRTISGQPRSIGIRSTRRAFRRLVQNYGNFMAENSGVDSPYNGLFPLLALSQQSAGQIGLTAQYVGDEPQRLEEFAQAVSAGLPLRRGHESHGSPQMIRQTSESNLPGWTRPDI